MFRLGLEGGRPAPNRCGAAPEWFYKGNGAVLRAHGESLVVPGYAEDGGEEAEIAGVYVIDSTGRPHRIGMATGNEFSDHKFEKHNYLNLAGSKLRTCALGPELAVDADFGLVPGRVAIERAGPIVWEREIATGEREMCHSVANIEHHHFKFEAHRRPGDVHVHYYGAHSLSFADEVLLAEGDVMAIQFAVFGRALRNPVTIATSAARAGRRAVACVTAMKICRFLAGDATVRIGLVEDDGHVVDLTPAGITTLSQVLESVDPARDAERDRFHNAPSPRMSRTWCSARQSSGRKCGPRE